MIRTFFQKFFPFALHIATFRKIILIILIILTEPIYRIAKPNLKNEIIRMMQDDQDD